ncbi:CaiB/BaiF CoA transferase family protein [Stella sp.]|uniref:CaiB/BaiF CoA transferase family protein n=1 Tax=Stella sp. TaxID=2912054 RepID=UPI0035AFEFC2
MGPLDGITVIDFSTLLPGPLATLILAEAGATVLKIERPGTGEDMRSYPPAFGRDGGANFALLNRGKRSIAIDLKAPGAIDRLLPLVDRADVVVEQFRPGVMDRLGLGWDRLSQRNPRLVYCSITGYGQAGPKSQIAGHDLNYMAETGLLALAAGPDGAPVVPPALVADIAGGTYPAVINILLALTERQRTGAGRRLDIAMTDNLFTFMYWAMGDGIAGGEWPRPAGGRVTGGWARYRIYRTGDDRFVAAAPLEDRFWSIFCDVLDLPDAARNDQADPEGAARIVADRIRSRTAAEWQAAFAGRDCCCVVVNSLEQAMADPHFVGRSLFSRGLLDGLGGRMPALRTPVVPEMTATPAEAGYPALGEANGLLGG